MTENKLKQVFANNLNRELKIKKKTQTDLCNDLKLNSSTVSDWATAKKYPRMDKIQMIADYLGIMKSDLTEEHFGASRKSRSLKIPVLGAVPAGIPIEAIEDIIDYEEIDGEMARTGDFFALKIKGDSMYPLIIEDDIVIVRKQDNIDSGQVAIVMVNGDEATCKKVVKKENGIMLVGYNPEFTPLYYTAEEIESKPVRIIGKVMEARRSF